MVKNKTVYFWFYLIKGVVVVVVVDGARVVFLSNTPPAYNPYL